MNRRQLLPYCYYFNLMATFWERAESGPSAGGNGRRQPTPPRACAALALVRPTSWQPVAIPEPSCFSQGDSLFRPYLIFVFSSHLSHFARSSLDDSYSPVFIGVSSTILAHSDPKVGTMSEHTVNSTQSIADYLAQLLKDRKQVTAFPNVFMHVERLIDEGEALNI